MHDGPITNFGGNVRFTPHHRYTPAGEAEVLEILDRHADGRIRVIGALHAWSSVAVCEDVLIDLRRLNSVDVERDANGTVWARVNGGCRIKHLLRKLHALSDATLPTLGLITEQSIAGAIATGTHGSGKHSLSHYVEEVRIAAYDPDTGKARIFVYSGGAELRAARCALGCMGVILAVRFRCLPKYDVAETMAPCTSIDDALGREAEFPLQQVYLIPHLWSFFAQRRAPMPAAPRRNLAGRFYRVYWFLAIDLGLHVAVKLLACVLRSPRLIRFFFRSVLAHTVIKNRTFVDESQRMLVMEHELFKHLEIEIFVPAFQVRAAADFVRVVLGVFDGQTDAIPDAVAASLKAIDMTDAMTKLRGTFTHHYPICFRRVMSDDTLISMTADAGEDYYAISFITYVEPRDRFFELAAFLAHSMTKLFGARLHWGKYFPLINADIESAYPHLEEFRRICRRTDPRGVFRNEFTDRVLGLHTDASGVA